MNAFDRLQLGLAVLVLGRAGMDLYADPPGSKAEAADRFWACLGGSAGNIAAGLARAGVTVDLLSCVSDDAVGRFVTDQLDRYGIGRQHVRTIGGQARTSLGVTETRIENTQTVIYRNGAADLMISADQTSSVDPASYGALIVTGTALAAEPSRSATLSLMTRARTAGTCLILDLDYRPYSWASADEVAEIYQRASALCNMVVGNDEEFDVMAGGMGGENLASRLAAGGQIAIYKLGADGSRSYAPDGMIATGIYPVKAIKPMGAGDAFMANLVAGLRAGAPLAEAVQRGAAAAAMVVADLGCAPAMPDADQLAAFMA
jgi:5-dehydro-2-deoxygluconokinase